MSTVGPLHTTKAVRAATKQDVASERGERASLEQGWKARLANASPADLPKVKAAIEAEKQAYLERRAYKAELRAALITSAPDWVPPGRREGARPALTAQHKDGRQAGEILTSAYRVLGAKARELAAERGEAVTEAHVEQVKLTKHDVDQIVADLGGCSPAARAKATKLLEKHFRKDGPDGKSKLTADAKVAFDEKIVRFDEFHAAAMFDLSEFQEKITAREEKTKLELEDKKQRIENFVRDRETREKQIRKVQWTGETQDTRVDKSKNAQNVEFVVVNGRLVKAVKD